MNKRAPFATVSHWGILSYSQDKGTLLLLILKGTTPRSFLSTMEVNESLTRTLLPPNLRPVDENQQAFKDPLHVPIGPITRARSKKIKEALNGLIQEIWADSNVGHSKLGPKEDEGVIYLIQAIKG